ncbi:MAG: hypothetical protein JNM25_06210 [Planctomycetes bacterium]|nr:hypothetical protein [Planctomycetota bacterium]
MTGLPGSRPAARAAAGDQRPPRLTRRHVVLIALLPVLVAVWIPVMSGGRRPATATPPSPGVAPAPPVAAADDEPGEPGPPPAAPGVETAAAVPLHRVVAGAGELTRRLQALSTPFQPRWTRTAGDPFAIATPAPVRTAPTDIASLPRLELAARPDPDLVPTAVLLSAGQEPLAIIGGRTYRPGDEVAGHRIVTIEERRVVFRRGDRTLPVSIPAPTLGQEHDHD